jgi:hypothetical protein
MILLVIFLATLTATFILYKLNTIVKYYVKVLVFCGAMMVLSAFYVPIFALRAKNVNNNL